MTLAGLLLAIAWPANALLVQGLDGARTDIHDHLGHERWTLIFLWSTNCAPCEAQKPMIDAFHQRYRHRQAIVIGIALDGPAEKPAIDAVLDRTHPSYQNFIAFDDVFERQFVAETGR